MYIALSPRGLRPLASVQCTPYNPSCPCYNYYLHKKCSVVSNFKVYRRPVVVLGSKRVKTFNTGNTTMSGGAGYLKDQLAGHVDEAKLA